jgi:hypothetical protein
MRFSEYRSDGAAVEAAGREGSQSDASRLRWHQVRQINPTGKLALPSSGKSDVQFRPSHPIEGRFAIVTNAAWDAVDADCATDECV